MLLQNAYSSFILAMAADGLKSSTLTWYRDILAGAGGPFAWLASRQVDALQDVTTVLLREYIVEYRAAPNQRTGELRTEATINGHIRALHKFFAWCAAEYNIPNPMTRIAYPTVRPSREPKAISLEDLKAMFAVLREDAAGVRNRAIMALLLDSGVRAAGLCGLRPDDVQTERHRALVTEKGDRTRFVVYSTPTADALAAWRERRSSMASHFFHNLHSDAPLTTDGLRTILRKLARTAGVTGRVNPHSFRHAFAREYLKAGGDLATLSTLMGHRQSSTTISHYAIFTDAEVADRHESYSPMRQIKSAGDKPDAV